MPAWAVILLFCTVIVNAYTASSLKASSEQEESQVNEFSKRSAMYYCVGSKRDKIEAATKEARLLLQRTYQRLQDLATYVDQDKIPDIRTQESNELASTFRTFSAIIDKTLAVGTRKKRAAGVARVRQLANLAQTILNNLKDADYQVFCNDNFLETTDPDGKQRPGYMWDGRGDTIPQLQKWLSIQRRPFSSWHDDRNPQLFTLSDLPGAWSDLIAINPDSFKDSTWSYQSVNQSSYTVMGDQTFEEKQWHLSQVVNSHLTSALLETFTTLNEVADDQQLKDGRCTQQKLGFKSEWACIVTGAVSAPDQASKSPLHFRYLAIALSLKMNDWSTGWSRPLAAAKNN